MVIRHELFSSAVDSFFFSVEGVALKKLKRFEAGLRAWPKNRRTGTGVQIQIHIFVYYVFPNERNGIVRIAVCCCPLVPFLSPDSGADQALEALHYTCGRRRLTRRTDFRLSCVYFLSFSANDQSFSQGHVRSACEARVRVDDRCITFPAQAAATMVVPGVALTSTICVGIRLRAADVPSAVGLFLTDDCR